jgi:hypothetical protein
MMAKYNVEYACGHEGEVQLYGKGSERERKLEWLATQDCPACEKAAREARNAAANAEAAAANAKAGLATLQGSDKQIAWAETIRAGYMPGLQAKLAEMQAKVTPENAAIAAKAISITEGIINNQSAAWWIDRRDHERADILLMNEFRAARNS